MAGPTKADLQEVILEQQKEIEHLRAELAARDTVIGESTDFGYIVTSPNGGFTGTVMGMNFVRGYAFIPMVEGSEEKEAAQLRFLAEIKQERGCIIEQGTIQEYKLLIQEPQAENERGMSMAEILQEHAQRIGG